ncbi:hypothetical protein [Anaeromassilibacillus sp. Marseille-P3371]|uniref:hypothetical protein n=1 Tax=Anaeromassilibacillus sp. Marseille-P3371 TaxID=1944639 RepID=UPI001301DC4E|nr:hypothetical protein [Anaeromassilibacillus sp. Marseille-P3371]
MGWYGLQRGTDSGKHGTGVTPVYVNVMKLLELAFHDGYNPNTGKCLCPSRL